MKRLVEFDIIYISYDEPDAEENWADLLNKAPWAQRVHGVKGFDSAHKEAAKLATTDRFITVDGDNKIFIEILNFEIDETILDYNTVLSFSSRNNINGLVYGNGGLKLWPKEFVLDMKTHENSSEDNSKVDFCWAANYKQYDKLSSENFQNGSPFQAFRAGFREGTKMSLDQGNKIPADLFLQRIEKSNLQRLLIWCSIGQDIEYGDLAIYGARLGAYKTICTDWDFSLIRDYEWFQNYWESEVNNEVSSTELLAILKSEIGLNIIDMTPEQSIFFKNVYVNPSRIRYET